MKKRKALMVAILAFLPLVGCNNEEGPKEDSTVTSSLSSSEAGPVEVSSVTITPRKVTLYLDDEIKTFQLSASVLPENAENKNVIWSSDDENVATVDDSGLVTAVNVGSAAIIATSEDGNHSDSVEITVKLDRTQENSVSQLIEPSFLRNYNEHTKKLEGVENISTAPSADLTAFYENEENARDLYKVGNQNEFRFQVSANSISDSLEEEVIANPFTILEFELFEEGEYKKIEEGELSEHVSINETNDKFLFTEKAASNRYRLTVKIDASKYASVGEHCDDIVFEFEVFDGYNVYEVEELSVFDSYQDSAWEEIKKEKGLEGVKSKGIALHKDLKIDNDDVPSSFKYTKEDIENYIDQYSAYFNDWLTTKNSNRAEQHLQAYEEAEAKDLLIGSLKDWSCIYRRETKEGENYRFEGNYFNIDARDIKQVFAFSNCIERGNSIKEEYFPNSNGSHAQLFALNTDITTQGGGDYVFKNVSVIGNGDLSEDDNYMGGLITIKTKSVNLLAQNFITSKSFISFLVEKEDHTTDTKTRLHIDRCKNFDSYNSLLYFYGGDENIITNSYMTHAGGAIALLDDIYANKKVSEPTQHNFGTPKVDCYNVYFSNPVTGQEPWFVSHQASQLVQMMAAFGGENGWIGKNARAHGDHMNISDGASGTIDLIAIEIAVDDPLGNKIAEGGSMLEGHFNIYNDSDMSSLYAGLDMAKMASTDPYSQAGLVNGAITSWEQGNVLPLYRLMAANANSQGIVVESNKGGHGMLYDASFTNGVVGWINYPNYSATPLNGNQVALNADPYYEVDPFVFYNDGAEVAAQFPLVSDNMDNLASGEYMSAYIMPTNDAEYLGAFIKMAKVA